MRQKKSSRKRTVEPIVINIEDSEHKSKVVKSSTPTPQKSVPPVQTCTPTPRKKVTPTKKVKPIKINIKKPKVDTISERKRKRQNKEDEGVIDLATPTKSVTRSADTVQKMQTGKDNPRSQIPRKTEKGKGKKGKPSRGIKGKKVEPGMSKIPLNFPKKIQYR
ncbi:hypothetical protein RHGRI_023971 [Rhododendron griersonianum]|uniref:Uncharacterized protein n=1 Tax=Rhododendron griersonianum TaxID=479676 RepID=A0AAV6J9P8_9ERIC|nr:hypothetical protein RHGRI_023971 [Rhododendron griersonianum]